MKYDDWSEADDLAFIKSLGDLPPDELRDGFFPIEEFDDYMWSPHAQMVDSTDVYLDAPLTIPEIALAKREWRMFLLPRIIVETMQPFTGSIVQPLEKSTDDV